ncbi:MAG: hypothetical protein R3B09_24575 [Nannocystaceae bacterium]
MRARASGLLVGVALALTCSDGAVPEEECVSLCQFAAHCHFLPSSLGGHTGDEITALVDECVHRCQNTRDRGGDATLAGLRECLGGAAPAVCDVDRCVEAAMCVREDAAVDDEILGRSDVRIRLLDGVYWSAIFVPELCESTTMLTDDYYGLDRYCAALAADKSPHEYQCAGRPEQPSLCSDVDCEGAEKCDPSMCDRSYVPAAADCRYYGIESVQLGYRDQTGAMVLGPLLGCEEASSPGELFEDVPYGLIVPVALFHGHFTAAAARDLKLDPKTAAGREFCWSSWPLALARLTSSGETTMVVPTPSNIQLLDAAFERDRDFPVGCGCAFQTIDCEVLTDECKNGLDDDEDGLVDAEDFGCLPPEAHECQNGVDDDGDGKIDAEERECAVCGDGVVGPGEACDDGNLVDGDGCDDHCERE